LSAVLHWAFQLAFQTAIVLTFYSLTGFVRAVAGPPDAAFADAASQIETFLHGLCAILSAGVPLVIALSLLLTRDMQRRLMGKSAH
jgi:hypothetical protein